MNARFQSLLKPIATSIVLFFVALSLIFFLPHLVQSDPLGSVIHRTSVDESIPLEEVRTQYRTAFQLDQPIPFQFITFLSHSFTGDLGYSALHYPKQNWEFIKDPLGTSLLLSLPMLLVAFFVGPLLALTGKRSIPAGLAVLGAALCVALKLMPDLAGHNLVFACALLWIIIAFQALRIFRIAQQQVNAPYSQYAEALGVNSWRISRLRFCNVLAQAGSRIPYSIATIWSGILVLEAFTGTHGLGSLLKDALQTGDFPLAQAVVLVSVEVILILSTLGELAALLLWGEPQK